MEIIVRIVEEPAALPLAPVERIMCVLHKARNDDGTRLTHRHMQDVCRAALRLNGVGR